MAYATINKGSSYFNTVLYTGNGSSQSITGVGFQPDFTWIKERSGAATYHALFDVIRGVTKAVYTNDTSAETTGTAFTSFNSDGFTVGLDTTQARANDNNDTYVAWNWDANGAGVSNTSGTITSTVSANTTSGFSIVSYTGNATAGATVGHGLGAVPKMIIIKPRTITENWATYHASLGNANNVTLNTTNTSGATSDYNSTSPTSSVFSLGSGSGTNGSGNTLIAYCFADVKGFSKFGSYTGNSSTDGTFVYLGFKPALVIIKNITNGNNWIMLDNKRGPYNLQSTTLYPNTSDAETSTTTNFGMDFLSNGMKMRTSGDFNTNSNNASGNTYIYAAFAENPFVLTDGTPVTAR